VSTCLTFDAVSGSDPKDTCRRPRNDAKSEPTTGVAVGPRHLPKVSGVRRTCVAGEPPWPGRCRGHEGRSDGAWPRGAERSMASDPVGLGRGGDAVHREAPVVFGRARLVEADCQEWLARQPPPLSPNRLTTACLLVPIAAAISFHEWPSLRAARICKCRATVEQPVPFGWPRALTVRTRVAIAQPVHCVAGARP
jgi:hypothetical protein